MSRHDEFFVFRWKVFSMMLCSILFSILEREGVIVVMGYEVPMLATVVSVVLLSYRGVASRGTAWSTFIVGAILLLFGCVATLLSYKSGMTSLILGVTMIVSWTIQLGALRS